MRFLVSLVLVIALCGCAGGDGDVSATTDGATTTAAMTAPTRTDVPPPASTDTSGARVGLSVYFMRGERIGAATREVASTRAVARAALAELLAGPDAAERAAGLRTAIPSGTRLLDVDVGGALATVDLSGEFESGGGSLSMRARVAQIVHTLTQFPTVRRVAFRIDGRSAETIGGEGVIVDPAVGRGSYEDLVPPILVEWPGPGDTVDAPLSVRGTANTFEATLFLRVVDATGQTLVDQLVTATSGSGTRGTFSVALDVAGEGAATLIAYERSAEDGGEIHAVRIPIRFAGG